MVRGGAIADETSGVGMGVGGGEVIQDDKVAGSGVKVMGWGRCQGPKTNKWKGPFACHLYCV